MCYSYIYDTIEQPYHMDHRLYSKSIKDRIVIGKLADSFIKILYRINIISILTECNNELPLPEFSDEITYTNWLWTKVQLEYPQLFSEFYEEIQEITKTYLDFVKHKFRIILGNLFTIHRDHTVKEYYVEKSLGPVPFHELVLIRIKAKLPSPEYKSELYSREDIYC